MQGKDYLQVHNDFMDAKPLNDDSIDKIIEKYNINDKMYLPLADKKIKDNMDLADILGIERTPSFVVSKKIINGNDINALRAARQSKKNNKWININIFPGRSI